MELKDVILSTLAEMDDVSIQNETVQVHSPAAKAKEPEYAPSSSSSVEQDHDISDEAQYLESVKERLLVLFEGFQSPNNVQIEAKIDLTLNFLEYLLSTIDTRLDTLKKRG